VVDWRCEDLKYPTRRAVETDSDYKKRCSRASNFVKEEAKVRHANVQKYFFDPLGVHLEPNLRPTKPELITPYLCNNVAQTRLFNDKTPRYYPNQSSFRAYSQAKNHDGYRLPHQLYMAERFNLKPCWFVHAMAPTAAIKDQRTINFHVKKLLKRENIDLSQQLEWQNYLADHPANGFYNVKSFMHYRFWFFDLDNISTLDTVLRKLKALGLLKYLVVATQTSPGKFHLYFKSELIAGTDEVANWLPSNKGANLTLPYDPQFIEDLLKRTKNKTDPMWQMVGNRGVFDGTDIHRSEIPLPGHATDAEFRGDNASFQHYKSLWHRINTVLGGDIQVHNGTRVAQLPFYRNPKSGRICEVVYTMADAPRMRLVDAAALFPCGPVNVVLTNNVILPTKEGVPVPDAAVEHFREKVLEVATLQKEHQTKAFQDTTRLNLPDTPEEYAKQNDLFDKISWDLDITGKSNDMLLLISKFAWRYVDLANSFEVETFYQKIFEPYFRLRSSEDLAKDPGLEKFKQRFLVCCETNLRNLKRCKFGSPKDPPPFTTEELIELFRLAIESKAPDFFLNLDWVAERHYDIILAYFAETLIRRYVNPIAIEKEKENILLYEFFFTCKVLNQKVPGYTAKLLALANVGFFTRGQNYKKQKKCKTSQISMDAALVTAFITEKENAKVVVEEPVNEWAAMAARFKTISEPIEEPDFAVTEAPAATVEAKVLSPVSELECQTLLAEKREELKELELDPKNFATTPELEFIDSNLEFRVGRIEVLAAQLQSELTMLNNHDKNKRRLSKAIVTGFLSEAEKEAQATGENIIGIYGSAKFEPAGNALLILSQMLALGNECTQEFQLLRDAAFAHARDQVPQDRMSDDQKNDRRFKIMAEMARIIFRDSS